MPSILITGVSSGIGRACANLFAEHGWSVTGTVRDVRRRPGGLSESVALERLDLAEQGSATRLARRLLEGRGCPDVLLANAGMLHFGPLESTSAEDFELVYRVNVLSQVELIRALVPAMRERGSGTIANVTSLGGTLVFPFFSAYNSTKWAMEAVSEGLWHELRPFGVRVKAIEPGFVATAIWGKALPAEDAPLDAPEPYHRFLRAMLAFERTIKDRTSSERTAEEVFAAVTDDSDRLRYPVAAYARALTRARRFLGGQRMMRFFHERWMGPDSG